ncbi:N-acyl homoserine lactonase family protein [Rhodococcus qingshengii]|uniref:N-acyl homoserine lactonase family protein n=1 Tax=Rhodococcus erythropolis group TaxID=2840174 RepID=UPI001F142992|nr:N-acyl homoserine lactonase family protein [Rhodococcus qingshengii]ULD45151.1 N-acyl homoserine lactonase family protein [Rhodococcus qingshengii]
MNSSTALRLWALDAPTMDLAAGDLVVGAEGTITFPLPAFLIEHDRGLILFDTSFAPLLNDDPHAYFGDLADTLNIVTNPEQRIDRQLSTLGFRTEDVTHVVLSHTHCDHSGGLYLFPQAKFFVGPGEFNWAANPSAMQQHLMRDADLAPTSEFDWTTIETSEHDLLGDGSIQVLHTPGHTPGELSCLINLPSQSIVLTGDTVHLREGLDREVPDPHDWNPDIGRRSIQTLKRLRDERGARIWIGHDPEDWNEFGGPLVAQE